VPLGEKPAAWSTSSAPSIRAPRPGASRGTRLPFHARIAATMNAPPIRYAQTRDGVNIAFYVLGRGPPVVHLYPHVTSHMALGWRVPGQRRFIEGLARHLTVIGLDWRGCGLSDVDIPGLTLDLLCEDIAAVLRHLGISRTGFCAWGFAGMFALAFAAKFPSSVGRLVIGEVNVGRSEVHRALLRLGDSSQQLEARARLSLVIGSKELQEDLEPLAALHDATMFTKNSSLFRDFILATDLSPFLANVVAPTLFLHAVDDALMPISAAQALLTTMSHAALRPVPGISPVSVHRDPGALTAAIDFLLASDEAARAKAVPASLSGREVEVLQLLALGKTNQQIADELVLSLFTVNRHVSNIYSKTGVANRAEAASFANRHGLV
jgi:pimeloyl-ACP methyl ester carboxylesterase/DNA-binding CsgD family transcriptional regulator